MTGWLILAAVVAVIGLAILLWWLNSTRAARHFIDADRRWAEMQIEFLGREMRGRMQRAADEALRLQHDSPRPPRT